MLVGATFVGVKKAPEAQIFGSILGFQMSQNSGFRLFCEKVSSVFTSVLFYMLIGATFKDV